MAHDVTIENPPAETTAPAVRPRRNSFFSTMWGDLSGAVITVAAGTVAAWRTINKSFYQNIKILPEIGGATGLNAQSQDATKKVFAEAEKVAGKADKRGHLFPGLKGKNKLHQRNMDSLLAEKYGIENTLHKLKVLRPHQLGEVAVIATATMAVALGAVITLAGVARVSSKQKDLEDRLNAMDNGNRTR